MWTQQYDIIVETLTGSQFEVTVTEKDTVGYIKSRIQKYEGIPVDQQHLIYNQKELLDKTEIKDIPLVKGSTVKLVLDMKGGPVSARRVVTLPGYDKWFDLSDVLSHAVQDSLPVKLLVYKDCKKNIHRVMKLRADRKNMMARSQDVPTEFSRADDETHDDQWRRDNMQTLEKMGQLKFKLDSKKKKSSRRHKLQNQDHTKTTEDQNEDRLGDKSDNLLIHGNQYDEDKLNIDSHNQFLVTKHNQSSASRADNCFRLDTDSCDFNRQINSELDDMFLMNGIMISDDQNIMSHKADGGLNEPKSFSLSPRRPTKVLEKSNFSRFFHHRNSSPTLNTLSPTLPLTPSSAPIITPQPIPSTTNVFETALPPPLPNNLDKNKRLSQSCSYISDNRNKLRDNLRRNRSFKLIDNNLIIEENESPNRVMSASSATTTSFSNEAISNGRPKIKQSLLPSRYPNSTSVQDLIEHISYSKFNSSSSSSQNDLVGANLNKSKNIGNESGCELIVENGLNVMSSTNRCTLSSSSSASNGCGGSSSSKFNKRWNGGSSSAKLPSVSSSVQSSSMTVGSKAVSTSGCATSTCGGYENKLFMDKEHTFSLGGDNRDKDFKLENSFRFYKMTSDSKNCYELPKLLIREDSPVESFHSSDSQLETIALRGNCNSPKDVMDPFTKIHDEGASSVAATTADDTKLQQKVDDCRNNDDEEDDDTIGCSSNILRQQSTSLLKLYDSSNLPINHCDQVQPQQQFSATKNSKDTVKLRNQPMWHYHNSDLGLNKLELNFLNDDNHNPFTPTPSSDCEDPIPLAMASSTGGGTPSPSSSVVDMTKCHRKSNCTNSGLKVASSSNLEINKWNSISQFNGGKPPESTASLNFINGNLSSDDEDNDDVFNSCELLHQNSKSKSVELNEFRMMFGSSPTLLNTNNYNFNSISQTSRLDAVPFQYRRGYSNLNDACLSSSTSDLECFQQSSKKKVFNKNKNELPSLYRHRNNEHLDYIRSYENLDRTRIVRMRNDRINGGGGNGSSNGGTTSGGNGKDSMRGRESFNMSRDRCLQEEDDSYDNFSSYSNLCFDNDTSSIGCIGTGNINRKMKKNESVTGDLGFPSDESIFNINFDNFEDDVLEIDTRRLFDNSIDLETPTGATHINPCTITTTASKASSLLLPEIDSTRNSSLLNSQAVNQHVVSVKARVDEIEGGGESTEVECNLDMSSSEANSKKISKKKPRCAQCNKKLGVIMIMKCHCEKVFCAQHRYAEAHNCTYNFKQEGKKILAKENPLVVAQKLPKI